MKIWPILQRNLFVIHLIALLAMAASTVPVQAFTSLGLSVDIISGTSARGSFPLVKSKSAAPLFIDEADYPGVLRAASDLQTDIERVSGVKPSLINDRSPKGRVAVIVGTLGKSALIDTLVKSGKLKAKSIAGQWEAFVIATVARPLPGVDQALVIAGSDKRGTIYGIYEISEQIGVSPWYWWADVPAKHHESLFVTTGTYIQGPPTVKYRGIFINDEEPALGGWSREKFGGVNSKMYTHMFELLLRLRGNYLWPAMWGKAFNEDDLQNPKLADEYGIVMGTSHHEPMIRAQAEWGKHRREYGNGEWNYLTNEEGLKKFWSDGIARNKDYESVVTVGMRGDGDVAMPTAGSLDADIKLLERIIDDQRSILKTGMGKEPSQVPQLWALFTEVQKFYDNGMKVPDDVTLLFTDDNVGDLRRVPTPEERKRSGSAGIYFHMDMNGGPFSYKWLNSNPLPKVWEQMNLAHQYGANRIWIANVGDLKPLEVPIEFFLRMAWRPESISKDKIGDWTRRWAERDFGSAHADEIADLVSKYAKYNGWRKPELIRPNTFSLTNYREAERVSAAWNDLVVRAQKLNTDIPPAQRDAYYQLVLHPIIACANQVDLYVSAGRNQLYAKQGRASTNAEATRVQELFDKDKEYSNYYNKGLAGGKWSHMMDQVHIGYTSWDSPRQNIMPRVTTLTLTDNSDFGVALDGSTEAWPGSQSEAALPVFDSLNPQRSYIDVFARGSQPLSFSSTVGQPWILLTKENAPGAGQDKRVWVNIDWSKLPVGSSQGTITISGSSQPVSVKVMALKASTDQLRQARGAFGGLTGPIAFLAQDATKNVGVGGVRWETIPDLGRGPSGMEIFPVTAASIAPPNPAPYLEYPVFFAQPGTYKVDLVTSPTLDILPGRALGIAVSIDDQPLQAVNVFTPETQKSETFLGRAYNANTANNARIMHFTQTVAISGKHTLKITMIDPTIVLQKIIIHDKDLPESYFGPVATPRNPVQP